MPSLFKNTVRIHSEASEPFSLFLLACVAFVCLAVFYTLGPAWEFLLLCVCVCVNCGMTVCYNYRVRERGSVVGKVLCDEGLRLRKGLWQRLKDRKGREIRREREGGWVNSWHSRHSLPEIAVAFLSRSLRSPSISLQQFAVICKRALTRGVRGCQSENYSKHMSWGSSSSLHKQQCWGMKVQREG